MEKKKKNLESRGSKLDKFEVGDIDIRKMNTIFSTEEDGDVALEDKVRVKKPSKYHVILHNDDYTTMEFVIWVLMHIFNRGQEEAMKIMLDVHNNGRGVCGTYSYEVAETKMNKVMSEAKKEGHPLLCTVEPE
ncbi:ATP-dependent Clp protease adapter ClpS [Halobacteriovorax sp. ZH3_bin.1]|uniref:ATP-dependent Clp protease adapter ClpS n=1 Tax=Halobacteriovorax sp. ZH3_bin.1 TaxID=3157725 RepID=UPI00371CEB1F